MKNNPKIAVFCAFFGVKTGVFRLESGEERDENLVSVHGAGEAGSILNPKNLAQGRPRITAEIFTKRRLRFN